MDSYILTFISTHDAMKEEEELQELDVSVKMIPTPRGISSECGFSIKIQCDDVTITEKLTNRDNSIDKIYLLYRQQRSNQYEEIYRR